MKRLNLFILLSLFSMSANADLFGEGEWKIVAELKAMYETMIETLEQAKAQNEALNNVKSTINDIAETRDNIKNFDVDRIVDKVQRDFDNLTELDDLSGLTSEQKIEAIRRELERRVDEPDISDAEREAIQAEIDGLDDIERRNELLLLAAENANKNLAETGKDLSTRDSSRITAESLATIASIEAQRELRYNQERIEKLGDAAALKNINDESLKMMKQSEKTGW